MPRLALVCDFAEEGWTSMDHVGEMLAQHLQSSHRETIDADRLQPALRRRATVLGVLRPSRLALNGDRLWNRMVEYPRWLRKHSRGFDLFHILDHSYAHLALTLPAERTIITCHDLDPFRCLFEPTKEPRPLWFRTMAQRILTGLRSARHVIFVSEAVRQEADRLGLIPKTRSSVVHNGADDAGLDVREAGRQVDRLLGIDAGELLLLSVGTTVPRKRIDVLLRVFAGISNEISGVRLIRIGGALTGAQRELARQLGITQSIIELPFVERAVLDAVYRRSTMLLQPSDSEGFGLPVAEAMARGCPVVASDIPALREVGGQAAIYCPAGDVSAWIKAVADLLQRYRREPALWNELRSRSVENAGRFRWSENAARVVSVYQEVLKHTAVRRGLSGCSQGSTSTADSVSGELRDERFIAFGHGR